VILSTMLARLRPLHPQLRMHSALPVQHQHVLRSVLIVGNDNFVKHRSEETFLQFGGHRQVAPQQKALRHARRKARFKNSRDDRI
jgi:hypothetical protein